MLKRQISILAVFFLSFDNNFLTTIATDELKQSINSTWIQ